MTTAICMMAKAPVAGLVKTRLCPPLSGDQAATLSAAFALDTWRAVASVGGFDPLLFYAGDREAFPLPLRGVVGFEQAGEDLGARIENAARIGLDRAARAIVIGSDAPALPGALLRLAAGLLEESDAVLGPALDGGYYLIGLRRCEPDLLAGLPWSERNTFAATRDRLIERGYAVAELPAWFDVDDGAGLSLLRLALRAGALDAPATAAAVEALP